MSLDAFDHIALEQKYAADDGGFDALFHQGLTVLSRTHPQGFHPQTPGRAAWDGLDETQRELALDMLLYVHFCDFNREQAEALHLEEVTSESSYLQDGDLDQIAHAAVSARRAVTVDSAVLWRALKEIRLLNLRAGVLRHMHTSEPISEEAMQRIEADLKRDLYGDDTTEGGNQ